MRTLFFLLSFKLTLCTHTNTNTAHTQTQTLHTHKHKHCTHTNTNTAGHPKGGRGGRGSRNRGGRQDGGVCLCSWADATSAGCFGLFSGLGFRG
jgi:hypothetical protein